MGPAEGAAAPIAPAWLRAWLRKWERAGGCGWGWETDNTGRATDSCRVSRQATNNSWRAADSYRRTADNTGRDRQLCICSSGSWCQVGGQQLHTADDYGREAESFDWTDGGTGGHPTAAAGTGGPTAMGGRPTAAKVPTTADERNCPTKSMVRRPTACVQTDNNSRRPTNGCGWRLTAAGGRPTAADGQPIALGGH